jgi:hypothetical protein
MRLMPILLRYYAHLEREWAGLVTPGTIQRPPYKWEEWSTFVRKVAERYKGRVTAWEVWNEPTMSGAGFTPKMYAELLKATATPMREVDPAAKIIGFAGVELHFIKDTLALGTAPLMDAISEHSYAQIHRPEMNLPKQTEALRAIMAADGGEKPIWHTEQGVVGDDDGYRAPAFSEAEVAALYTRNTVILRSLGIAKYFWFSAQTSPTYGDAVFYENYIPRPRLAALNACASFLEGAAYRRSYQPTKNTYAYLFNGSSPVCVVWNMNAEAWLHLDIWANSVEAFDLMGTRLMVSALGKLEMPLPAEQPVYLRGKPGQYEQMEKALAEAKVTELEPVAVTAWSWGKGASVKVTIDRPAAQDGVVEVLPASGKAPAPQWFDSMVPGESRTFLFAGPNLKGGKARVRFGNRQMREVTAAIADK